MHGGRELVREDKDAMETAQAYSVLNKPSMRAPSSTCAAENAGKTNQIAGNLKSAAPNHIFEAREEQRNEQRNGRSQHANGGLS
jgi:hypothetical protein